MEFANVNWIAVVAGTVVAFLFGWLVYSPMLFAKAWAEGSGVELTADSRPPMGAMLLQIAGLFFLATVIGVTATINALFAAILAILAAASLTISNGAFCGKSRAALTIDAGYIIGAGILMIAAQGIL
ncbi:DUF1761 domain-containing protein [Roseibium sp. SCP14]|uniref:DUF1761 domain-containing protein n=1 Tax=Roseibium sp. SCP14 TaxID=3141375 RepID=UPI00333BC000